MAIYATEIKQGDILEGRLKSVWCVISVTETTIRLVRQDRPGVHVQLTAMQFNRHGYRRLKR